MHLAALGSYINILRRRRGVAERRLRHAGGWRPGTIESRLLPRGLGRRACCFVFGEWGRSIDRVNFDSNSIAWLMDLDAESCGEGSHCFVPRPLHLGYGRVCMLLVGARHIRFIISTQTERRARSRPAITMRWLAADVFRFDRCHAPISRSRCAVGAGQARFPARSSSPIFFDLRTCRYGILNKL